MNYSTLIIHDDPLISDTLLGSMPRNLCSVGDFIDYELFLSSDSRIRYQELKDKNFDMVIVEREIILGTKSEQLVLYVTSKPA